MSDPMSNPENRITPLCPEDAAVLDAMIDARAGSGSIGQADRPGGHGLAGPMPPGAGDRGRRLADLLALIDSGLGDPTPEIDPGDDLVARTMQRIAQDRQRRRFTQQVQMLSAPRQTLGVAWHQILTAAAVFLIAASLLMPVLERNRAEAARVACAYNLGMAGMGFGSYAVDHNQALPRGAVQPGAVWWNVGKSGPDAEGGVRSNAAHLYILVRSGYVDPETLACPDNAHAPAPGEMTRDDFDWSSPRAVSFSYQNQSTDEPIRLDANPSLALLADKNPLFVVRVGDDEVGFDAQTPTSAPSRVHGSRGQNVLTADGTVAWTIRPFVDRLGAEHDNIWVLQGVRRYQGNEAAKGAEDSFLVP